MIKDHFYLVFLQKVKENEIIQLQQGGVSVLEYETFSFYPSLYS